MASGEQRSNREKKKPKAEKNKKKKNAPLASPFSSTKGGGPALGQQGKKTP
jgi:hypothetical protein